MVDTLATEPVRKHKVIIGILVPKEVQAKAQQIRNVSGMPVSWQFLKAWREMYDKQPEEKPTQ